MVEAAESQRLPAQSETDFGFKSHFVISSGDGHCVSDFVKERKRGGCDSLEVAFEFQL